MQSETIMDMLTTPTAFPLKIDWEGKMEPSSPSDSSFTKEESIFDETYDYYNEGLYENVLEDLIDTKPDTSELLSESFLDVTFAKLPEDLCYDDKEKISSSDSALLASFGSLPPVVDDEFYPFILQPEATKGSSTDVAGSELMMGMELINQLTPPQTPPQTMAFGGVGASVLSAQPLIALPLQFQPQYAPLSNPESLLQQQQQHQMQAPCQGTNVLATDYYIVDEYSTLTQIGAGGMQQEQPQQQQQLSITMEPLQQVPADIGTAPFNFAGTEIYTPQQLSEMENIVRSLQMDDDEDSLAGFSEAGSIENGDSRSSSSSSSSASSIVARSPVYSDSAESYYGGSRNDGDDEDWSPSKPKKLNIRNGGVVTKKRSTTNGNGITTSATTTRAYGGRGVEEKKSRKKEQNKNAATRYRQKKKAEIEEILIEESKLRERNEELKRKSQDLGREISCIKKLMREFCLSKGLI